MVQYHISGKYDKIYNMNLTNYQTQFEREKFYKMIGLQYFFKKVKVTNKTNKMF